MWSHEEFHIIPTGLCRGTSCCPGSWWSPDWELGTFLNTFSLTGLLALDFIIDPMDHHDTPDQEPWPKRKYQFQESHGTQRHNNAELERKSTHSWTRMTTESKKMIPEVQKNCNSSSMRLESKTLETYMPCYDPQLQGISCDHKAIVSDPCCSYIIGS